MSRSDDLRTSDKRHPIVGRPLMRLVRNTYFKDVDVISGQASPLLHPSLNRMPPTLVLTAEFDTLRHESNDLADKLRDLGVQVTHHQFPGIDHGFTHQKPVGSARHAIAMVGDHLAAAYAAAVTHS
ncbi:alpha/beta hydrolase [Streptomyces sp. NPDC059568]|uniref:alpha/beta hydrolase n=1 Tax=Streptomyces sp. NPDC059568 TaxID=3346868 RepID=UPI00367F931D